MGVPALGEARHRRGARVAVLAEQLVVVREPAPALHIARPAPAARQGKTRGEQQCSEEDTHASIRPDAP